MAAIDPNFRSADTGVTDVANDVIVSGAHSVTTTAAEIYAGAGGRQGGRKYIIITPTNGTIYIGQGGVTALTGTPIFKNQSFQINLSDNQGLYAICASGTVDVRVIEAG